MPEPTYAVVSPIGRATAEAVTLNERLPDPAGTTIGFVWDDVFRGDEMFAVIREELAGRYQDLRFVGHEAFGNIHGHDERDVMAALPDRLRAEEVDAVIIGVGA